MAITLNDVFQVVIVPRAPSSAMRLSRWVTRYTWWAWPRLTYRLFANDPDRREDFLGTYAPFNLVLVLATWVAALVVGWGTFFYGIRAQMHPADLSYAASIYYAGTSLFTIGYGDYLAVTAFSRIMSLVAAASGLGTVAIVTSFLFALFGSFQAREQFVVTLASRAGVPPSGVGLLAVHAKAGLRDDLARVLCEGQNWTAHVMESHLAYPTLIYFRSSHDFESWVGTLGALLDASVLILSAFDDRSGKTPVHGQALIMYGIGSHLTHDFGKFFHLEEDALPVAGPGIDRREFDVAYETLRESGYALIDADAAWIKFSELRARYALHLNELARWLEIPPIQWVGDRSILHVHTAP